MPVNANRAGGLARFDNRLLKNTGACRSSKLLVAQKERDLQRERERERDMERETERQRQTETGRQTETERLRHRDTEGEKYQRHLYIVSYSFASFRLFLLILFLRFTYSVFICKFYVRIHFFCPEHCLINAILFSDRSNCRKRLERNENQ